MNKFKRILFLLCFPVISFCQTHISDTLYNPTDVPPTSTVQATLSIVSQAMQVNGSIIVKTLTPYSVVNGVVNLYLEPNDTTTNTGSLYTVNYTVKENGGNSTVNYSEKWVVPTTSSTLTVSQVRVNSSTNIPPSIVILGSQIQPGANGQYLQTTGGVVTWGNGPTSPQCTKIVTFTSSPVFDFAICSQQLITLTGNVTPSILHAGYCQNNGGCTITFIQGSTPYTVTWPGSVLGGFQIGTINGKRNIQSFTSIDGANIYAITPGIINQ